MPLDNTNIYNWQIITMWMITIVHWNLLTMVKHSPLFDIKFFLIQISPKSGFSSKSGRIRISGTAQLFMYDLCNVLDMVSNTWALKIFPFLFFFLSDSQNLHRCIVTEYIKSYNQKLNINHTFLQDATATLRVRGLGKRLDTRLQFLGGHIKIFRNDNNGTPYFIIRSSQLFLIADWEPLFSFLIILIYQPKKKPVIDVIWIY